MITANLRSSRILILLLLLFVGLSPQAWAQDTPTPTETATVTATATSTATATVTLTPTWTAPPTPTLPPGVTGAPLRGNILVQGTMMFLENARIILGRGGTAISASPRGVVVVDLASVSAATCLDTVVNLTGTAVGSECVMGLPAAPTANLSFLCFVPATNRATIRACNVTASPINPASATYSIRTFAP